MGFLISAQYISVFLISQKWLSKQNSPWDMQLSVQFRRITMDDILIKNKPKT